MKTCKHIQALLDYMERNHLEFEGDTQVAGIKCKICKALYGL